MPLKAKPCKFCSSPKHSSMQCFFRPRKNSKPCKHCDSTKHLAWQCLANPNRKLQTRKKLKTGKQTMRWNNVRDDWFKEHPASEYYCYIGGGRLNRSQATLDHVEPRGSNPKLRYVHSNLKPCCWFHNGDKGSKSLDKYLAGKPDLQCRVK